MRSRSLVCLVLALSVALPACVGGPRSRRTPAARPLPDVGLPAGAAGLLLTVYPTPRSVSYGEVLLPVAGHRRVDVASPEFLDVLAERELLHAWMELPAEGYLLEVAYDGAATLVVVGAADEAGARWADEALRQLTWEGPEGAYVRDCMIVDRPAFPLRGNKRPQPWELPYRANFAWSAGLSAEAVGRDVAVYYAPGATLDASNAGLEGALATFGPPQRAGVRRLAVKFDDVGFGLTPASRLAFGSYPRALVSFMRRLRMVVQSLDPDALVYYLPQTYWWNDERFPDFARAVRLSGGLDADVGLVLTGPEIISERIDAEGLATARRAFGLTRTKALIYDNLGREGDWGPLTGRDAGLVDECDGVFGERGTPVNRLTRLDWSWNPVGYSPERSWSRAILELAGPAAFEALRDACRAFRESRSLDEIARAIDGYESAPGRDWVGPLPRSQIVRLLREDLRRLAH